MYFRPNDQVFLNGNWVPAEKAQASLYSQTMHYGYGVFDGMRSYKNADGCNIFRARDHFARLINSANILGITIPYTEEELERIAYRLLEKNGLYTAYIRPLVFLGPNMELNVDSDVNVFIAAWPWKKYLGHEPINVMVSQYQKPSEKHTALNAKVVGNYTNSILASTQAKKLGYDEALMLDENHNVAEGAASNFFFEKDDVLYTPPSKYAIQGITRDTIMKLASEWGIKVVDKEFTIEEVYDADYAFFTGTATEVSPIATVNGEHMKKSWEESHAYMLYMMYRQQVMNDEYLGLTIV